MTWNSKYFFGNKISDYGLQNNRIDYRTLSQAFQAILNNDLMSTLETQGFYFEQVNGIIDNSEEIEEKENELEEIENRLEELENDFDNDIFEELTQQKETLEREIEELQEEENGGEIFQYYILDDNGARILQDYTNEIVFYNEELDLYIWGVTHYGTSWDYVLTDIRVKLDEEEKEN